MINAVAIEEWRSYSSARRLAKALEKRLQSFIEEQFKIQVRVHLPRSGLKNVLQAMAMEIKGRAGRPRLEGTAILQRLYEQAFEEGKIKPEATPADVREILLKEAGSLPWEEKQIVEQLLNSHWFAVRKRISGWQNAKKNNTL
jgi:hypothetical protein